MANQFHPQLPPLNSWKFAPHRHCRSDVLAYLSHSLNFTYHSVNVQSSGVQL